MMPRFRANSALPTLKRRRRAAPSTTGDAFASFLLGTANYANRVFNASFDKAYFGYKAWYSQDTWKVTQQTHTQPRPAL